MRRAALGYAAGRFGLFALVALLLWLGGQLLDADVNGLSLLLLAFAVSSILGYLLFGDQRRQLAESLDARRQERVAEDARRRARLDGQP